MDTAKRSFRTLAEFFRGRAEFSVSGNESDRDALRLWRPAFAEASADARASADAMALADKLE